MDYLHGITLPGSVSTISPQGLPARIAFHSVRSTVLAVRRAAVLFGLVAIDCLDKVLLASICGAGLFARKRQQARNSCSRSK